MSDHQSIIIVDDNIGITMTLADVLIYKGFKVFTANSGEEALVTLRNHSVDILLTDMVMPKMNGLELYRATKKISPHLITYVMSAYADDTLIQQGLEEGIKNVLDKPIDMGRLVSLLEAAKN